MAPEVLQKEIQRARRHLEFVFSLYQLQSDSGRYYLHEHPAGASSWKEKLVLDFTAKQPDAIMTTCAMCAFGMRATRPDGTKEELALKRTRWLTNCTGIASRLNRPCSGDHPHTPLLSNRARQAQVYPPALCKAIVQGLKAQLRHDESTARFPESNSHSGWNPHSRGETEPSSSDGWTNHSAGHSGSGKVRLPQSVEKTRGALVPTQTLDILAVEEMEWDKWEGMDWDKWDAEDDVKGGWLPPQLVYAARLKELSYLQERQVYTYSTVDEAKKATGRRPLRLK